MDEAEWLSAEVQKPAYKNAKYRIVCIHMPVTLQPAEENATGYGLADCSKKFASILNDAKVDLLLAGHTHQFKVIYPRKGLTSFPIIVGGAPVSGNNREKTTYTLVEADQSGIRCFLKKENGDVIEVVKIAKHK
jgi:2',3'-cyclic-nucleotide 2'-phosphodiesterase (5'-nucleotidase family)